MEKQLHKRYKRKKLFFLLMFVMIAPLLMGVLCPSVTSLAPPQTTDTSGSQSVFGQTDFSQLKMFDANNGWATTPQSVLRTSDGGQTWTDLTPLDWEPTSDATPAPGSFEGITGAYFLDPNHAWIVGVTSISQNDINSASTALAQATVTNSGTVTVPKTLSVGTDVYVRSTIDGGNTWMTSQPIKVQNLSGVSQPDFINAHEGWLEIFTTPTNVSSSSTTISTTGLIYTTLDGGVTWNEQDIYVFPTGGQGGGVFASLSKLGSALTQQSQQSQQAADAELSVKGQLSGLSITPDCVTGAATSTLPQCAAPVPTTVQGCTVTTNSPYLGLATGSQANASSVWLSQQLGEGSSWTSTNFVPVPGGAYNQAPASIIASNPPVMFPDGTGILPVQMQADPNGADPSHYFLHLYSIKLTGGDNYTVSDLSPTSTFAVPLIYTQNTLSAPDGQHVFVAGQDQSNGTYNNGHLYEFNGTNWVTLTTQTDATIPANQQTTFSQSSFSNLDFISDTEGWATDGSTLYHITVSGDTATFSQVYPAANATSAPVPQRTPGSVVSAPTNPATCGVPVTPPPTPTSTPSTSTSNLPANSLTGYWQDFTNGAPAMRLSAVNSNYDIIAVAFADADSANPGGVTFSIDPDLSSALGGYTDAQFISDIATLHAAGKKVILSVGGQNGAISVSNATSATNFANSVYSIMQKYGFDGVDIDLENGLNPTYMASALQQLSAKAGSNLIITLAPQTVDMQSTSSDYFTLALDIKNILTRVNMQYYNSGSMLGCDGKVYAEGTEDFLTAQACIQLQGGLSPSQVGLGLPASSAAAGSGYVAPSVVSAAIECLEKGTNCGSFKPSTTYPNLGGAMDWSINWDDANGNSFASTIKK
jgi:chitinase